MELHDPMPVLNRQAQLKRTAAARLETDRFWFRREIAALAGIRIARNGPTDDELLRAYEVLQARREAAERNETR